MSSSMNHEGAALWTTVLDTDDDVEAPLRDEHSGLLDEPHHCFLEHHAARVQCGERLSAIEGVATADCRSSASSASTWCRRCFRLPRSSMWSSDAKRTSQGSFCNRYCQTARFGRRFTFRVRPRDHAESTSHTCIVVPCPKPHEPVSLSYSRHEAERLQPRRRVVRDDAELVVIVSSTRDIRENRTPFVISAEVVGRSRQVPLQMDRVFR